MLTIITHTHTYPHSRTQPQKHSYSHNVYQMYNSELSTLVFTHAHHDSNIFTVVMLLLFYSPNVEKEMSNKHEKWKRNTAATIAEHSI